MGRKIALFGLRGAIENEAVHAVQQVAGELKHLFGRGGKLGGAGSRLLNQFAHLFHRAHDSLRAAGLFFDGGINFLGDFGEAVGGFGNLSGANRLFVGGSADFLGKFVNFGDHAGDLVESGTEVVAEAEALFNDAGAAIHVFDGLAGFPLNAGNQFSNFLGGLRGFFGQLAHFVGNHGETKSVFPGARGFDGRVKREQVGLFREVVDDFDNAADIVSAMAEHVDDFGGRLDGFVGAIEAVGGLFHGLDADDDFFARAIGDIEQNFGGVGDALNGRNHLFDGSGCFCNAGSLYLSIFHDVLHVDAHLVHGAGDFFNGRGRLHANFRGFIGGAGNLIRTGGNLSGGIASGAHDFLETVGHATESIAESVALRTRNHLDAQIAFGNRHGNGSHFLEVSDKIVESSGESANLIVAMNVNVLIEVAGRSEER